MSCPRRENSRPVVCGSAGLRRHDARRQRSDELRELSARQASSEQSPAVDSGPVHLNDLFCQVDADDANFVHRRLLPLLTTASSPWLTSNPSKGAVGHLLARREQRHSGLGEAAVGPAKRKARTDCGSATRAEVMAGEARRWDACQSLMLGLRWPRRWTHESNGDRKPMVQSERCCDAGGQPLFATAPWAT